MTGIFKIKCLHQGTGNYLQQSLWAETEANNLGDFLLPTKCTSFCLLWFKPFLSSLTPTYRASFFFSIGLGQLFQLSLSLFSHSFLSIVSYFHSVLPFLSFSLLFPGLLVHCSVPPAGSLKCDLECICKKIQMQNKSTEFQMKRGFPSLVSLALYQNYKILLEKYKVILMYFNLQSNRTLWNFFWEVIGKKKVMLN